MLSWILLIVALIVLVVLGTWIWGLVFGPGEIMDTLDEPANVIYNNRSAVRNGRLDKVKFEVVSRGYRQDQVDDLIAQLEKELASAQKESKLEEKEVN